MHVKCGCNGEDRKINIAGKTFRRGVICDTLPEQSAVADRVLQVRFQGGSLPIISPYNCFLLWYIFFTDRMSMAAWPCFLFYQEICLFMLI